MPRTQIPGEQVTDETIRRKDLNTTETGQAVVRKILVDSTLDILSTGVDSGTGDVTLSVSSSGSATIEGISSSGVGGSGTLTLAHGGTVPFSSVPIVISIPVFVTIATLSVGVPEPARTYDLELWQNPHTTPVFLTSLVTLPAGQISAEATGINFNVGVGFYGLRVQQVAGAGGSSTFKNVVGQMSVKAQ